MLVSIHRFQCSRNPLRLFVRLCGNCVMKNQDGHHMHHLFRSRFLIDSLSVMGYCSSYSEVQRFENNAAAAIAPDMLGGDLDMLDMALLIMSIII